MHRVFLDRFGNRWLGLTAFYRSVAGALTLGLLVLSFSGCGDVSDAVEEFKRLRAILAEIEATFERESKNWTYESSEWREEIAKIRTGEGRLADATADFLENGISEAEAAATRVVESAFKELQSFAADAVQDAGAEARLSFNFVLDSSKEMIKAVGEAIDEYEKEIKRTGGTPDPDRFKAICSSLAKQRHLEPRTGFAFPREVTLDWNHPDKLAGFTLRETAKRGPFVDISGYGFQHPSAAKNLTARPVPTGKVPPDSSSGVPRLQVQSDALIRFKISHDDFAAAPDCNRIELLWKGNVLHSVPVRWVRKPTVPSDSNLEVKWSSSDAKQPTAFVTKTKSGEQSISQIDFGIPPAHVHLIGADLSEHHYNGPMERVLDLSSLACAHSHARLRVTWDDDDIEPEHRTFILNLEHKYPTPPIRRRLYVKFHGIDIYNKGYHKDQWNVEMSIGVHKCNVPPWSMSGITDNANNGDPGPDGIDRTYTRYTFGAEYTTDAVEVSSNSFPIGAVVVCEATLSDAIREKVERQLSYSRKYGGMDIYRGVDFPYLEKKLRMEKSPPEIAVYGPDQNYGVVRPDQNDGVDLATCDFDGQQVHRVTVYDEQNPGGLAAYVYFTIHEVKRDESVAGE